MLDRVLKAVSVTVGALAIAFGLFLSTQAAGAVLEELMWFFAALNIATGLFLLVWQSKGKQWLSSIIK